MTAEPPFPIAASEKSHPRTEAALQRLRAAMRDIETEIRRSNGIYPFNHGRVTQSELCRRADVKKATLQNPVHKDTTRVEIIDWLDRLNANLMQTRDGTRERITAVAETLSDEVERLTAACEALQTELATARQVIGELAQQNAVLRSQRPPA